MKVMSEDVARVKAKKQIKAQKAFVCYSNEFKTPVLNTKNSIKIKCTFQKNHRST